MIVVFGANGQLGRELVALAALRGVALTGLTRSDADIADETAVEAALDRVKPWLVINAGAYTAVDKAESEGQAAMRANAEGPGILAQATAVRNIPLIHISTDYVFDGSKTSAYTEEDATAPLGVYGASKLAGEWRVKVANPRHLIVRTAWVYGVYGNNFLKTMLRLAKERDELRVVGDQRGCPTATSTLAKAILHAADVIKQAGADAGHLWGTYHVTGRGETTWHGFASKIVEEQAAFTGRHPVVTAISTTDYPTPAKRPANSVLSNQKFHQVFSFTSPDWQDETRNIVRALLNEGK